MRMAPYRQRQRNQLIYAWMAIFFYSPAGCSGSSNSDDTHVGSRDCAVISAASPDPATDDACTRCQNMACDTMGCDLFPCVDNALVVQGCNEDLDCSALPNTPFCGKYSAPDNVCVKNDNR
jgi:hypothetical protein